MADTLLIGERCPAVRPETMVSLTETIALTAHCRRVAASIGDAQLAALCDLADAIVQDRFRRDLATEPADHP